MSKVQSFLLNALLLSFGTTVAVGFLEVALRIVPSGGAKQWYDRPPFYYNPTGAETLQGLTHSPEKNAGVFRVAVVGDSFSFAPHMQYDDAFPKKLERMLNLEGGKAEVINYAVPAYSTTHEVDTVKLALKEGADLVILQITLNDPEIKGYRPTGITVKQNPYGAYVEAEDAGWLAKHSKLASLISGRLHNRKSHQKYQDYYFKLYSDKRAIKGMRDALKEISVLCKERGVPLRAVVFPLFGTAIDSQYPFTGIHGQLSTLLQEVEILSTDLLQHFMGIPAERLQVMPGEDFHPNEIGHRMAAEKIYSYLEGEKLLPDAVIIKNRFTQRDQILLKEELRVGAK